ncbi:MAG: shikimate kinase [Candidatus Omnitrophota bacterium]
MRNRNIVLVGFMGTGKTAVGMALASRLGREFIELDEIIEKKEGASIREIFEKKGEPYFRKVEKQVVSDAAEKKGIVISAGGGAIINKENLKNFKKNGLVVCLEASPEVIVKRTKGLAVRPLLNVPDPRKKIEELLQKRAPYYKKADLCVNTNVLSIEEVVDKIIALIDS